MNEKFLPGFVRSSRRRKAKIEALKAERDALRLGVGDSLEGSADLFMNAVGRGDDPITASVKAIRHLVMTKRAESARSFAQSLVDHDGTASMAAVAMGAYLHASGFPKAAHGYFGHAPKCAAQHDSYGYVDSRLHVEGADALASIQSMAAKSIAERNHPRAVACLRALLGHGYRAEAIEIACNLPADAELVTTLTEEDFKEISWIRQTVLTREAPIDLPDCDVVFGLMDYKLLSRDRTSSNVGDYVQTLAALANIVRHERLDFRGGDPETLKVVRSFADRVSNSKRIEGGTPKRVGIVPVDRDYSSGRTYRQPVWMISNGWFMHASERGKFDFPYQDAVRPIFVSFHINHPYMLTPQAVTYLKAMEPIGCRDWSTVYQLIDHGVDAFFTGCLTTTVGLLYEDKSSRYGRRRRVANVEAKMSRAESRKERVEEFVQVFDGVRDYDLATGLRAADEMLKGYRSFDAIYTSRLHCYLPCRSLGLEVNFRPKRDSDIRFEGLAELDAASFTSMRNGLEAKLAEILSAILDGRSEAEVRAQWRELCAEDVAHARARVKDEPSLPATSIDVNAVVTQMTANWTTFGPGADRNCHHYAFAADKNLLSPLYVTIESLLRASSSPITINLLVRDIDPNDFASLAARWPEVSFRIVDCSSVNYPDAHLLRHTSVSTLDRLFLPELFPALERLVYLDVDVLVRADPAPLFEIDLCGHSFAGRATTSASWRTGLALLNQKAAKMKGNAALACRMRRWAYSTGEVDFHAMNAGVLVFAPRMLAEAKFTEKVLAMVEAFGFHDQDAINFYCRSKRVLIDPSWNYVPAQDYCSDPRIVHWAGPNKPWGPMHVLYKGAYASLAEDVLPMR